MPLSLWSATKMGLVAAAWIAIVAVIGPRLIRPTGTWTSTAPDGTVDLRGVTYSPHRDLYIVLAAFGPAVLLAVVWWVQRR